MATIVINEQELRDCVQELIASDEDFKIDPAAVNVRIDEILSGLIESPEDFIAGIILDDLYYDAEEKEIKDIEIEK